MKGARTGRKGGRAAQAVRVARILRWMLEHRSEWVDIYRLSTVFDVSQRQTRRDLEALALVFTVTRRQTSKRKPMQYWINWPEGPR